MKRKKDFQIGDVVRQHNSTEEGRIVRIVDHSNIRPLNWKGNLPKGVGYIVSLPAYQHPPVKEALWREEEIAPADCL